MFACLVFKVSSSGEVDKRLRTVANIVLSEEVES